MDFSIARFHHRAIALVLFAVAVDVIGFGIITPVLPALIRTLGHTDMDSAVREAGWMLVVFAVAQFFAGPVVGHLGDRFGRRPVLVAAMLGFSADYLLMAAAPTLGWLFIGRAIAGITGATVGPAGAVIADVTPPEKRATVYGMLGAAFGVGFVIGPALGGLVVSFGMRAPFMLAAILAATVALLMIGFLPETLAPSNRRPFRWRDAHVVGAFRPLFGSGNALPLLVAWLLWQLGGMVYPSTWAFWAAIRLGWGATDIGWSMAWAGLLTVIAQVTVTERMVERLGERRTAIIGLACMGGCLMAYAFVTTGWQVYAFFLVGALGALVYPALNGMLSGMVGASRQGALQGGLSGVNSVAAVFGPLIASQALAWGSTRGFDGAAFMVAALLVLAAIMIIARSASASIRASRIPGEAGLDSWP